RVDARDPPSAVAGLRRLEPAAAPAFAFPRPPDWALVAAAPADEFAAVDPLRVVPVERPLVAEARAPVSAAVVVAVLRPLPLVLRVAAPPLLVVAAAPPSAARVAALRPRVAPAEEEPRAAVPPPLAPAALRVPERPREAAVRSATPPLAAVRRSLPRLN